MSSMIAQDLLVTELAHELVPRIAPYEMRLFEKQREAYLRDPLNVLNKQLGRGEAFDGGTEEALIFLTPIVLTVLAEVVNYVTEEVEKSALHDSKRLQNDAFKQVLNRTRPDHDKREGELPVLTSKQLAQVHKLAFEKARQHKVSKTKSQLLADTVASSMSCLTSPARYNSRHEDEGV